MSTLVKDYGAPRDIWIRWSFDTPFSVSCRLTFLEKTPTRLPEAAWISFNPIAKGGATWEHAILGEWSDPQDVAPGAAKGLHYVSEDGVRLNGHIQIQTLDAPLLRWGLPKPFPTPVYGALNLSTG